MNNIVGVTEEDQFTGLPETSGKLPTIRPDETVRYVKRLIGDSYSRGVHDGITQEKARARQAKEDLMFNQFEDAVSNAQADYDRKVAASLLNTKVTPSVLDI